MAQPFSNADRVAIILMAIGEELSAELLKQMPPSEAKRVIFALHRLKHISKDQVDRVLQDFTQQLQNHRPGLVGGAAFTQRILQRAYGNGGGEATARQLGISFAPGLPALEGADPRVVANFLQREHPQTAAIVLAHCESTQGSEVLKLLDSNQRMEVILRLAKLEAVDPEILEELNDTIRQQVESASLSAQHKLGGPSAVAKILNSLDAKHRQQILDHLEVREPAVGAAIAQQLFTINDLLRIDAAGIQRLLRRIDQKTLKLALKPNEQHLRQVFLQQMSQNAGERLLEDIAAMPLVSMSEVDKAREELLALVREEVEKGTIQIHDQNEVYV